MSTLSTRFFDKLLNPGIAGSSYIPSVQAALPRLLGAAVPAGAKENRRHCVKVIVCKTVLKVVSYLEVGKPTISFLRYCAYGLSERSCLNLFFDVTWRTLDFLMMT